MNFLVKLTIKHLKNEDSKGTPGKVMGKVTPGTRGGPCSRRLFCSQQSSYAFPFIETLGL